MKIIVFGATGKTGKLVCLNAIKNGNEVTGFARSRSKIEAIDPKIKAFQGDAMDPKAVAESVTGRDVVIFCLGSVGLKDKSTLTNGIKSVIESMENAGVKRLVALSAAGVNESWRQIPLMSKILFKTMLKNIFADHHTQEALIEKSGLDWTIVRAATLTNKPESGKFIIGNMAKTKSVSRVDVANFLVKAAFDHSLSKEKISITD